VKEVNNLLSENPPNMGGVLDLARQFNFPPEVYDGIMYDIKSYMNSLFEEIFVSMGMPYEEAHRAAVSMSYAFGAMGHEEYMQMINGAFSGELPLLSLEDFINTQYPFNPEEFDEARRKIYDGVTGYLYSNLGKGGLGLDEKQVDTIVNVVQIEMEQERGPDFFKLPGLFKQLNMDDK